MSPQLKILKDECMVRLYATKGSLSDVIATAGSISGKVRTGKRVQQACRSPYYPLVFFSEFYSERSCLFSPIVSICALTLTPNPNPSKETLMHYTWWAYGLSSDTQTGFPPTSHSERNAKPRAQPDILPLVHLSDALFCV